MIVGDVAAGGVTSGTAFVGESATPKSIPRRMISESDVPKEMERFDAAVSEVAENLHNLQRGMERQVGSSAAAIFAAHNMVLHDTTLRSEVATVCLTERVNVEAAIEQVIGRLTQSFDRMENPQFRERAADFRDIGHRILNSLIRSEERPIFTFPKESIVVTDEILPSLIAQLERQRIRGLVLEHGGQTAHAIILARSLGIPALIQVPQATKRIHTGDHLIVDGVAGRIFIDPPQAIIQEYDRLKDDLTAHRRALEKIVKLPSVTTDGVTVKLLLNAGKAADALSVDALNADGIGLYRTEFIFMVQDHFPTEEEQYQMYRVAADRAKPRGMVIRVLDLGSDKYLRYFPRPREDNPSLGRRGIRLLLKHPEVLRTQLRAILRLSATHLVSVLFPMVGDLEELLAAKAVLDDAKTELVAHDEPYNRHIPVGAMIETPSAIIMADRLAKHVDFFSVGTNDLVQYLLASDRTSSEVASYYEPLHPAVLQSLHSLATIARERKTDISICGEMAGNPAYTALLLGMGFRSLSVNSAELLTVKNVIRSTSIDQAESLAGEVLALSTVREIKACLQDA